MFSLAIRGTVVIGISVIIALLSLRLGSQTGVRLTCPVDSAWDSYDPGDKIARDLPEFGGIYRDTVIRVLLTDLSVGARAEPIVRRALARRPGIERETIRFLAATFSHRQLRSWRECLRDDLVGGVSSHGLMQRENRILIGVVADSTRSRVELAIHERGLPREAFIFEHMDYARPLSKPPAT
jgi:hypothetical protein